MNGDFSRWTSPNAIAHGYCGVLMQQGRLHTDADWNEAGQVQTSRTEHALRDIVGRCGTPQAGSGFQISAAVGGFGIAPGRFYLDGAMVENPAATTYLAQGGLVAVPPLADQAPEDSPVLVYLQATQIHVTAQLDSRLADPALGGVDTATRLQAAWRVAVQPITLTDAERAALIDQARCGGLPAIPGWEASTGGMVAGTIPAGVLPPDSDCLIPPEAGYLSQENQLYRVQIVRGGSLAVARFVWSRENASVEAVLAHNADGDFILQGNRDDAALGFVSGGWVEVFDAADQFFGRTGPLTQITLTDGIATFVPGIGNFADLVRPRVRRWDHGGISALGLPVAVAPTALERGIEVRFANGTYADGDFWVFEARAATGNIVWPPFPMADPNQPIPSMGWGGRRAPLALARRTGAGLTEITDIRGAFPTLNCLQATDIGFDNATCALDAANVQEALEALCRRTSAGLCSFVAGTVAELRDGVANLAPGQSVRICLKGASFPLASPLELTGLGHVIVEGTGPHTIISVADAEVALLFRNCASVRVIDLSINGGPVGTQLPFVQAGRLGAITAIDCGDVVVERVRARCRAGLDRAAACIATRGSTRSAQVLVRDCTLTVGQAQIGINIIGASRAVVENNLIVPVPVAGDLVRRRIIADPVLVARLRRSMMGFVRPASSRGLVTVQDAGGKTEVLPVASFAHRRIPMAFGVPNGAATVRVEVDPDLGPRLAEALRSNTADRISLELILRRQLTNIVSEAVRNQGRAVVGSGERRLFGVDILAGQAQAYLAQGIVIAGDAVDEARVTGNRIERAIDGIRIAASGLTDRRPPAWQLLRPTNSVTRVTVNANTVTVAPLSLQTAAFGIFLGHVDSATVGGNDIRLANADAPENDTRAPHFGVHQFGFRGPRVTLSENTVVGLAYGYAVIPSLSSDLAGVWRLRDNAAAQVSFPYVFGTGVQVI